MKIWRNKQGFLTTLYGEKEIELHIKQCFPWSNPGKFLSLRDKDDNEIILIEDLDDCSLDIKKLIEEELKFSQFILTIESIEDIEEDVELRRYNVMTTQGPRIFQTKLEDWPELLSNGEILIEDLSGDIFKIEDISKLKNEDREKIEPYIN